MGKLPQQLKSLTSSSDHHGLNSSGNYVIFLKFNEIIVILTHGLNLKGRKKSQPDIFPQSLTNFTIKTVG